MNLSATCEESFVNIILVTAGLALITTTRELPVSDIGPPDMFDSLLLPEASDSQAVLITLKVQGDDIVDPALAKTSDPRFAIGTSGRENLWQLLATISDPVSSKSVWRQDMLDELTIALAHGSVATKLRVAQALRRPTDALKAQAHAALLARVRAEDDAWVMEVLLGALAEFRTPLEASAVEYVTRMAIDLADASQDLAQSEAEYDARITRAGRHAFNYMITVNAARVVMQSAPHAEAAMLAVAPIRSAKPGAVAEAMVRVAQSSGSVYAEADAQARRSWIADATALLVHPEARSFVRCCIREAAAALYLSETVPAPDITSMIIASYEAQAVDPRLREYTSELISACDDPSAIPPSWLE